MARRGCRVQVLTSNHRLPPMGGVKERGVFRELCLYEDSPNAGVLGRDYAATYRHERHNAESLYFRLQRLKPDCVWIWNMRGLSKSLVFQLQARGVPIVFDLHSDWLVPEGMAEDPWFRYWNESGSLGTRLRRSWLRVTGKARRHLAMLPTGTTADVDLSRSYLCSQSLRHTLLASGVEGAEALPVIYPFVDASLLKPKWSFRSGGTKFMWAGRLTRTKAPDIAIASVGLLKERGVEVQLDLYGIGQPSERKAFRAEIERLGLVRNVRMRSIRPGELIEHYASYDALLFTSRGEDPFSITLLEALLSKLPCLMSESGGIPEILGDLDDVIHNQPDDPAALADAIEAFLQLDDGGQTMAEKCILSLRRAGSFEMLAEHMDATMAL